MAVFLWHNYFTLFEKVRGELCHVYSGANFMLDDPSYIQDLGIQGVFGEDYVDRVLSAHKGNLITSNIAI